MGDALSIVNEALLLVGADPIETFGDDTTEQKIATRFYERNKKSVLRSYEWNCAKRRADLTPYVDSLGEPIPPVNGYSHQFNLPKGCIRVLDVFVGDFRPEADYNGERAYSIEGKKLLINEASVSISYTMNIPEAELDAHVEEVIILSLAADMCYPLKESNSTTQRLKNEFNEVMFEARTTDSLENPATILRVDGLSRVRY